MARGDTLYGIAREYEVDIDRLCSINGISKDSLLKIGMELKVPIVSKLPVLEAGKEDDNGHNDSVPLLREMLPLHLTIQEFLSGPMQEAERTFRES